MLLLLLHAALASAGPASVEGLWVQITPTGEMTGPIEIGPGCWSTPTYWTIAAGEGGLEATWTYGSHVSGAEPVFESVSSETTHGRFVDGVLTLEGELVSTLIDRFTRDRTPSREDVHYALTLDRKRELLSGTRNGQKVRYVRATLRTTPVDRAKCGSPPP